MSNPQTIDTPQLPSTLSGAGNLKVAILEGGGAGGGPVTIADGADVAEGATTDAEASGNGSVIAILKRIRTLLGGTIAVSGTFWQATQPVSAAALPLPNGAATDASLAALAKDATLTALFGSVSDSPGAYTVLDRLQKLQKFADQHQKDGQALLAVLKPPPPRKLTTTLLHRS